ncbi:NUDIX hydrolase [Rhizohabitans arisaemae]|uniref:NUDIX hydrolase n=1 Tax=Rhizohabitans arisaemae TaxID=2720610 RepID=UPI0024B21437|nr:NUDIX hydrolase [Rhizohabitans arisaemae]
MSSVVLPKELEGRARDLLAGRLVPAPARDAATVVLIRDASEGGIEVYLLRRKPTMAFAAGAYVFPGGSVDPRDADHGLAWAGPDPAEWARVFLAEESTARGLVCAAVRETFEESGVLLAGSAEAEVVGDTTGEDWERDREALIDRSLAFSDLLERRGLVLRSDLMRPWAHWITPEIESKRFDTRFFVAALPPGQRTRYVSGEADRVTWLSPTAAVESAKNGEMFLMVPTFTTLIELSAYQSVEAVLAQQRHMVPLMPTVEEVAGELRFVLPENTYALHGRVL